MSVSQRRVFWVGELSCLNLSARTLLSRDQSRSSAKQAFCLHLQDSSRGASFKWCLTLNFLCMLDRIRHLLLKMMLNITVLSSHSCSGNKGVLLFLKPPPRKTANSFCFFLGCLERELGHHLLRPPLWFFFFPFWSLDWWRDSLVWHSLNSNWAILILGPAFSAMSSVLKRWHDGTGLCHA